MRLLTQSLGLLCLLSCLPGVAAGQDGQSGELEAGTEQGVEEITVTVRKTSENLQEVPIAVSVLDAEQIERERIRTLADVAVQTPTLQFDQGFWPDDTRISIRGLFARSGRPSAAVLIDGIDASSESLLSAGGSGLLNQRLLNLERIEVARGPQSALYGRAAFSGGINYVTKRPTPEWGATLTADVAEEGRYELQGIFEGPITDDLAFGVLLSHYELDGWYDNQINGEEVGGGESNGVGFSLNWTPSDDLSIYWNSTYSDDEFDPQPVALVRANKLRKLDGTNNFALVPNATTCDNSIDECLSVVTGTLRAQERDLSLPPDANTFNVDDPVPDPENGKNYDGTDNDTFRTSLIIDWNMGWANLRSSTSYSDATNKQFLDTSQGYGIPTTFQPEGTVRPITLGNYTDGDFEFQYTQYYQEFQLTNADDSSWDWLLGLNGFYEDAESSNDSAVWYRDDENCTNPFVGAQGCDFLPTSPFPTTRFDKTQERDTTSLSVFGLVGFDLTDVLKLTLEGRLIYDKIEVKSSTADLLQDVLDPNVGSYRGLPGWDDDVDDTNFVPRASLDWQFQENVLLYTSVAKGIKPPTYGSADIRDPERQRIKKEELWTYEVGSKTQWFDNRVTFNTAVYYNDYTDQQVRISGTDPNLQIPVTAATNAGDVDTWGVEVDASWVPTENWLFNLSYAFADTEYKDFNVSEAAASTGLIASSSEAVKAGNIEAEFDGNEVPGIPEHALSFVGSYRNSFSADLGWYAQASWQWQDERYADAANLVTLDSYSLVNGQVGLEADQWTLTVYGENLFDDDTVRFGQEFIDQTEGFRLDLLSFPVAYLAYLPQPRTFGVRFQYRTR